MKRSKYVIAILLLILAITMVGCADKTPARTFELISINKVEPSEAQSLTIKYVKYFYLTLDAKSANVKFSYTKLPTEGSKDLGETVVIDEVAKCKLSKDKTTYNVKSGILKGDLVPTVAAIETIIDIDGVKYSVIFVLKA